MIADLVEADFGFSFTTFFLNLWRRDAGKPHVGRSTVYEACKRLKSSVTTILKRQQGSIDLDSDWCKASHRWSAQLLIMFGELKREELPAKFLLEGKLPMCFQPAAVRRIKLESIHFWDETHKKQRIGKTRSGTKLEYRFNYDKDGNLDLENGTKRPRSTELKMKYTKEARFCTGTCLKIDSTGNIVYDAKGRPLGKTLPLFEYSE